MRADVNGFLRVATSTDYIAVVRVPAVERGCPCSSDPILFERRTGGRVVEGTGLENRHTGEPGIESSNLSLSARVEMTGAAASRSRPRRFVFVAVQFSGWVAEWLKAHAWKVCLGQKPNVGSNPTPSVDAPSTGSVSGAST